MGPVISPDNAQDHPPDYLSVPEALRIKPVAGFEV